MVTASDREGHWVAEKIERCPTWPTGTRHADPHRMDPGHLRIFIVEDDPFQLETLQEVLEVAGHTVRGTDRGTVALRWLEEGEPCDLLIMDLGMPDMDGPQSIER
jgi:PleD family two-component response regulator